MLQRYDGPRTSENGRIRHLQQAACNGRVRLHQPYQISNSEIVALQQFDDRQGDAFGRRKFAGCSEFLVADRVYKSNHTHPFQESLHDYGTYFKNF